MANRQVYNVLRQTISLTERQRSVIFGTLLGDGSLIETTSKKNLRLQIAHCEKQKAYVFWKYEEFKAFVLSPPSYQRWNQSWRFRTISHPELTEIGALFYPQRKKIVPTDIIEYLDPLGLAVWFMDDGAIGSRGQGYILNTQSFLEEDVYLLREILITRFHIHEISLHNDKGRKRLYIRKNSMKEFRDVISPYLLPFFRYKLWGNPVETTRLPQFQALKLGEDIVHAAW